MLLSAPTSERGAALLFAIFALLIVSALSTAMLTSGRTEQMISANQERAAQARAAAEAGLNHGTAELTAYLANWQANGFANASGAVTSLLRGPDGAFGTSGADADNGSLENFGIPRPPARTTLSATTSTTYEVRVLDEDDPARGLTLSAADQLRISENGLSTTDGNRRLLVRAIGYADGGTITTLEVTVSPVILPAIVTNGDLEISGNASITGSNGGVHSNSDLDISGNPTISQNATGSGTYTASGSPNIGGDAAGGRPLLEIPTVRAIDYRPIADFILTSTGQMTTQLGVVICDASTNNSACESLGFGWVFQSGPEWKISSNSAASGTFYVEGDATISGNPGTAANPLLLTIIATGNIVISGNPDLRPDAPELLFVTDKDLKIAGSLSQPIAFEGQILVHEQLHISGNPTLAGQILVEDAAATSNVVQSNEIMGNPTFVSNGTVGSNTFTVSAWREVR